MNKSALKNFATKARTELLERVELEARKIGITKDKIEEATVESSDAVFINDRQLSDIERKQRNKLIARIDEIGFDRVMEEAAYTWFNRFVALRFMEVNDYLPTRVRVLSSENEGSTEPDMITEALSLDLEIDRDRVYNLKLENKTDELFKYLIKLHCNDLNRYMPFMFETIEDYNEILFPEGLLGTDSFVREMTDTELIPEENWKNVEIIGWLYQYYISDKQAEVFVGLENNIKITQATLPAATQLFTPNWVVKYMVENSLGNIWLESNPTSTLQANWEYFIDEAKQDDEVAQQLEKIRYENLNPEEITFLDPACGSGHILVYAFDVFYEMYLEKGYVKSDIPKLILENNLYGIDVDHRATQLASFALMMKAREKNRRVFRQPIKLNICAIEESNWLTDDIIDNLSEDHTDIQDMLTNIQGQFIDAKEYGSLINIKELDFNELENHLNEYKTKQVDLLEQWEQQIIVEKLPALIKQSRILSKKYDVVCTNPPYLGRKHLGKALRDYMGTYYDVGKSELYAAFILQCIHLTKEYGFTSMITIHTWMFISSYQNLRREIFENTHLSSMIHTGPATFEELNSHNVLATSFNLRKYPITKYNSVVVRLVDYLSTTEKIENYKNEENYYTLNQRDLAKIPNMSIVYWISDTALSVFDNQKLRDVSPPRQGLATGKNKEFVRFWHEVNFKDLYLNAVDQEDAMNSGLKWFPYNKGGRFRKWYGMNEDIVNWENDGFEIKNFFDNNGKLRSRPQNQDYYFKQGLTWSLFGFNNFSVRYKDHGFVFDVSGSSMFPTEKDIYYILSFLASKVAFFYLSVLAPTVNFQVGNIGDLPFIYEELYKEEIENLAKINIRISREDWDDYELSWNFKKHPLLKYPSHTIESSFEQWQEFSEIRFNQLKANEEELNRIFIDIYGLNDELKPEVEDKDVTVSKADLERDIKSFISYAVGCMLGRYSLDEDGLVYAGGEFDLDRYKTFPADEDNILPILPGAYFEDDIVTRFVQFVEVTYGVETLEENLQFVADAIGRRKDETPREAIRRYFLTPSQFYQDHVRTYKRTPIYWLFTSGRERAFNCLIYMHRYDSTTLSRIRTDYLHDVQNRYESEKQDLQAIIDGDSIDKEIRDARRELTSVERKLDELKEYDEKLRHLADMQIEIDLDDGVKENYKKFEGLVARL